MKQPKQLEVAFQMLSTSLAILAGRGFHKFIKKIYSCNFLFCHTAAKRRSPACYVLSIA